ncbi:MAG TPA: thiosulfate oxidation carrier protein SoxY [Burkholderiales bacterium]|nr:thiosulfate oxidation carrier protein SoxY [Burkholderiales bacterium]
MTLTRVSGRRRFIFATGATLALPLVGLRGAHAQVDTLTPLIHQITGGVQPKKGRVKLEIARIADNGNAVPLKVSVDSPMTERDYVKSIHVLSEKNPRPVIAGFFFTPHSGRAQVNTRIRLNGTQELVALATLSDGSFWMDAADILVTISACYDAT